MPVAKKTEGKDFPPCPEGTFQAVCYSVVDLGTHFNQQFGKEHHLVHLSWEIPSERIEFEKDGETVNLPRGAWQTYTLSLHEKSNLCKVLVSWRGRPFTQEEEAEGFDCEEMLGKNCLLQIVHNTKGDKIYANIASVMGLMKNMPALNPENPIVKYDIERDGMQIPDELPDWMKQKIKESKEYIAICSGGNTNPDYVGDNPAPTDEGDDIPF